MTRVVCAEHNTLYRFERSSNLMYPWGRPEWTNQVRRGWRVLPWTWLVVVSGVYRISAAILLTTLIRFGSWKQLVIILYLANRPVMRFRCLLLFAACSTGFSCAQDPLHCKRRLRLHMCSQHSTVHVFTEIMCLFVDVGRALILRVWHNG